MKKTENNETEKRMYYSSPDLCIRMKPEDKEYVVAIADKLKLSQNEVIRLFVWFIKLKRNDDFLQFVEENVTFKGKRKIESIRSDG